MAKNKEVLTDYTDSFVQGMITSLNSELLPPAACSYARNVVLDNYKAEKRFGYSKTNAIELAAAAAVRSLYYGKGGGSVTNKIMAMSGSKIYSMTTAGVATERATGLSTSQKWDFCEGVLSGTARIIMVAPGNAPYQWDGSAASASTFTGPATNCDYGAYYASRLWFADADLRILYSSNRDTINVWDAQDWIYVGKESDGPITRLVSMGRYLLIFMQKAVYILTGNRIRYPQNVSIEQVQLNDGCPAPWSVTKIQDKVFWVGNEGFYELQGRSAKRISGSVDDDFVALDKSNISVSAGERIGNLWVVSVPYGSSAVNTRTYCIHWSLPRNVYGDYPITFWDGAVGSCWAYSPGTQTTYFGSQTTGFVFKYDTSLYSDNTAAIPFELITRGLGFGDPYSEKMFTKIHPQLDVSASGSVIVSAGANDTASGSFVECPAATTAAPLSLATTGSFMGEYGGSPSWVRNGVVNYPLVPIAAAGDPLVGSWFRVRFYDSSVYALALRRVYYEGLLKAR